MQQVKKGAGAENTRGSKSYSRACRCSIQYQIFERAHAKCNLTLPKRTYAKGLLGIFGWHMLPPRDRRDFLVARISPQDPPFRVFHPLCETMRNSPFISPWSGYHLSVSYFNTADPRLLPSQQSHVKAGSSLRKLRVSGRFQESCVKADFSQFPRGDRYDFTRAAGWGALCIRKDRGERASLERTLERTHPSAQELPPPVAVAQISPGTHPSLEWYT